MAGCRAAPPESPSSCPPSCWSRSCTPPSSSATAWRPRRACGASRRGAASRVRTRTRRGRRCAPRPISARASPRSPGTGPARALWNPWIGGGRPGWLSSPEEGGAPLPVAAALLARPGWTWTALVALELAAALLGTWWVLRSDGPRRVAGGGRRHRVRALRRRGRCLARPGEGPRWRSGRWRLRRSSPGSRGASGWRRGRPCSSPSRRAARPALAFVALAAAVMTLFPGPRGRARAWGALLAAAVLVGAVALPRVWLDRAGRENPAPPRRDPQPPAPIGAWSDLVVPSPGPEASAAWPAGASQRPEAGNPAYLGLAVLVLAAVGVGLGAEPGARAVAGRRRRERRDRRRPRARCSPGSASPIARSACSPWRSRSWPPTGPAR